MIILNITDKNGKEVSIQYDTMEMAEQIRKLAEANGCKVKVIGNRK